MKPVSIILIVVFSVFTSFSQQDSIIYRPSTVGVTLGTFGGGINIELNISEKQKKHYRTSYIRVLGGVGSIGMGLYYYFGGAWGTFYGSGDHHFEMSYGLSAFYDKSELFPLPVANWGYRFYKPNSKFYFRTGIGSPEVLYIGIGLGIGNTTKNEIENWEDIDW